MQKKATRALRAERVEPASGETRSAVIFLHGYGANAKDLIGLAEPLAEYLPDTLFLSPDAPEECIGAPMGLQWFPIPWIDGSSEEMARNGVLHAVDDLQAFLDGVMVDEDLLPEQVVLFGFSQGSTMALHAAPRREDPVAAVVAFSGRLLEPELLADEAVSRPPVLLVHGDKDDVVPIQALPEAARALESAGWSEVYAHVMKGTGHGIAPEGLSVALAFMRERLGIG
jgi:phospholipase/carboxylesterase